MENLGKAGGDINGRGEERKNSQRLREFGQKSRNREREKKGVGWGGGRVR